MKYGKLNLGQIEALVNKLGGMKTVDGILDGTLEFQVAKPKKRWIEKDNIIYLSVTSDGTSGSEWIKKLREKGYEVSDPVEKFLNSDDFKPTKDVTYSLAILKGLLFKNSDRITKNIRAMADEKDYTKPNAEVACIIREQFSDEELEVMDLTEIIVMHEPTKDSDGDLYMLCSSHWRCKNLARRSVNPYGAAFWPFNNGFAFVASQINA